MIDVHSHVLPGIDDGPRTTQDALATLPGLRIVGVVYDDSRENARRWMALRGGNWVNLMDPGSRTAIEYGLTGVPETVFIARDGRVAHKQIGPVTRELVAEWVPRLLAEPAP